MSGSGNVVNYSVRPNKSIERNMMSDLIACLESVDKYRYIGLGAKYFVDFVMLHKRFGINDMICLEARNATSCVDQFNFNKPYECINIIHKRTTELLVDSSFPWDQKESIVWFDYDDEFNREQLDDTNRCASKLKSMSLLFISSNMKFASGFPKMSPTERLTTVCNVINEDKYTRHLTTKDMSSNCFHKTIGSLFNLAVKNALSQYNKKERDVNKQKCAKQIAFFEYADSVPMMTIGWIIFSNHDKVMVDNLGFDNLPFFVPEGNDPFTINVPPFTYKELAVLNKHMPNASYPITEAKFISEADIYEYNKVYRYYPTVIETGLVL